MNKIFKVIWNHAAQRFVVTSELTKSNGKSSSSTDNRIEPSKALLAISVAGAALLGSASAMAATVTVQKALDSNDGKLQSVGNYQGNTGSKFPIYMSMFPGSTAGYADIILIGNNTQLLGTTGSTTIIGANASGGAISTVIGAKAKSLGEQDVVIGAGAEQRNTSSKSYSTVIGGGAAVGENGAVAVSIGYKALANNSYATAIGGETVANGAASTAIGYKTNAEGGSSLAMGFGAHATGSNTVALGVNSAASGFTSFAGGSEAKAQQEYAIAIGAKANSNGANGSTAVGWNTGVTGESGVAIGTSAKSFNERAIAIGRSTWATGVRSTAMGQAANTGADYSIAIGNNANVTSATATNSIAMGNVSTVSGSNSIAIGPNSNVTGNSSTAVGVGNQVYANNAGAFGDPNTIQAGADGSYAFGNNNTISGANTFVLGNGVTVGTADSVILGNGSGTATAVNVDKATVGPITYSGFKGSIQEEGEYVSVGANGDERQIKHVAAGQITDSSTDAINGSQLYAVAAEIGKGINIQNNAGTNVSNILPGEAIAFKNGNLTTANVSAVDGNVAVSFDVDQGTFNTTQTGALVANTSDTGVATVADVANAVNSGYWNIGNGAGNVDKVSFGDEVRFLNGTNTTVTVAKNGNYRTDVTYDTDFSKLPVANTDTTTITNDGGTIKVDVNTGNGSVGTDGTPNANNNASKVANISSVVDLVANVGWNVYQESVSEATKKDLVKAGDNVVFAKGANTTVSVETLDGGKTTIVKYDVDLANVNTAVKTGTVSSDETTGVASSDNTNGNIATVGDVANAINKSGWKTTLSNGNVEVINPGDTVNYLNGTTSIANVTKDAAGNVNVSFEVNRTALTQDIAAGNDGKAVLEGTTTNGDNFVTAGDVMNTINNVYWVATSGTDGGAYATSGHTKSDEQVKAGNTVTFKAGNGLTIKQEGKNFTYAVATGSITTDNNGKANSTTTNGNIATVGDIVETINNVYHSVNSSKVDRTNGESTYTANGDSKIKAGGTVNYNAGQNIKISGTGNDIVFSTTENVTFKNADVTNNLTVAGDTTVNNFTVTPDSKIDMGGNIISNVSSGVEPTDAVNVKQLHDAIGDATSSLVWKVTDNNNAANVTNVGNQTTVSFNNGEGTSAIVDGTNVTYNVNVDGTSTQITYVDKDGNSLTKNADGTYSKADGSAVDAKDVTGQVSVAFGEVSANTTTGVVSTPDTVEKVASTKDVRDAINGSGFTLTTSNSSTGAVSGTTSELINPGETITIDAGNNINITQSGNKVSVATSMTPTFTTVQVGGDSGPVISGDANGDVKVAKADGSAAKITNVAPGEVSRTSTDAVNGSQLYAVANGIDNKFGDIHNKINRNNKDLRAGVAGANAAAALPQVFKSGRSMVAASAGTFKGQSAVAVGYSRASDNGKLILKLQGNANSRGDVGGGVGVGYQW